MADPVRIRVKIEVKVDYMSPAADTHEQIKRDQSERQIELYLNPFQKVIMANLEMLLLESN